MPPQVARAQRNVRVLGIDPSTVATGWGVLEAAFPRPRYVTSGVIRCRGGPSTRLAQLHRDVLQLLTQFCPDHVSLEQGFSSRNVQAALRLGEARGVVLAAAGSLGVPVTEYPPATIKLAVTGDGRASKAQMQAMVRRLLGLAETPPEDAADALGAALCHLHTAALARALPRSFSRR